MYDTKDTTITIYNRFYSKIERLDLWKRTVIHRCSWHGKQNVAVSESGLDTADSYTVRVFESFDGFVSPAAYAGEGWTVANGDVVVKGEIEDEVTKISDITSKYDECFIITGHSDNRRGVPFMTHIRISGK